MRQCLNTGFEQLWLQRPMPAARGRKASARRDTPCPRTPLYTAARQQISHAQNRGMASLCQRGEGTRPETADLRLIAQYQALWCKVASPINHKADAFTRVACSFLGQSLPGFWAIRRDKRASLPHLLWCREAPYRFFPGTHSTSACPLSLT